MKCIRYKSVPDVHVIFRKLLAHLEPDFEAKMTWRSKRDMPSTAFRVNMQPFNCWY